MTYYHKYTSYNKSLQTMEYKTITKKNINILHWNANGILNKTHELPYFLHIHKIDIMLINETKLIKTDTINIKGYTIYRKDRNTTTTRGGGVAILVKKELSHQEFILNTQLEAHAIIINNILIVTLYSPPQIKINIKELKRILKVKNNVFIAGDLNAKHISWHCYNNNKNGKVLYDFVNKNSIAIIAPDNFTLYPNNSNKPSTVDIALAKNINTTITATAINDLNSDHNPIIFKFTNTNIQEISLEKLNYQKTNWDKFRKHLNSEIIINNNLNNITDIDNAISKLTTSIQTSINQIIPKIKIKQYTDNIQESTLNLIKIRNGLNKKFQRTRQSNFKTLRNQLTYQIKKEIQEFRNKLIKNKLETLNTRDNTLWNAIKMKKHQDNKIPTIHGTNGLALADSEKAEAIAEVFERVHRLTENLSDDHTENLINTKYKIIKHKEAEQNTIKLVSAKELKTIIKKLKPKKAPGIDNIQNIVLKNLPKKALVQLIYIYNACLKLSYFPAPWKIAKILPFKKPGKDPTFPQNYRPISLLATMGKVLETIINNRLNQHLESNNIIIPEQFGFRKFHSTTQQLARLTDHISTHFNKNKNTGLLLLDIEKAFDTVWRRALIYKLNNINTPHYLTKFINNYLTNRKFIVTINNNNSNIKEIAAGVPQGSILGPKLFLLYINDIPKHTNTNLALFADDTAVYATSGSKDLLLKQLQNHINILEPYYNKWKIKINVNKTELLIFTHKDKKYNTKVKLFKEELKTTKQAKYLGLTLDTKLHFSYHINTIIRKTNAAISILYSLINKNSYVNIKNKILIYKICIRPIMVYAAPLWSSTCKSNYKKLQTIQNRCLRLILSAEKSTKISELHEKTNIKLIKDYIKDLTEDFYYQKLNYPNIVKNTCKKFIKTSWDKYKLPQQILLV